MRIKYYKKFDNLSNLTNNITDNKIKTFLKLKNHLNLSHIKISFVK